MKEFYTCFDNIYDLNLKDTFTCGQCFRWYENEDASYTGVIKDGVLNIIIKNKKIAVSGLFDDNMKQSDFEKIVKDYLDFGRDYKEIQKVISKNDDSMKEAIKFGKGIRILNQDPWEMLISFITSACNNIPRISKTIDNISKKYGKRIKVDDAKNPNLRREFYLFPTPNELGKASVEDLRGCNLGFRDKYVFEATKKVLTKELDLNSLKNMDYMKAKKELSKIAGVGSKVADCILLFSYSKMEAFPVDTWIKQIMNEIYIDSKNAKKIEEYAHNKFGEYAGIAQQYLFYYKRENKKT